ncbi:hypothetical protein GCM10007860_15420 [Chitiniphilus shinanonensis]|uniref:Flagellar basal-body/hook protein C-terminal domain-containing protein n=1 Tax=Chitiniphilus shinanonensis TaxID=553088 RepID=A0ABQ6BQV2_9NEIS|nr:hypothetical protein [Chitiniphilus shinanonensis]GLS04395.1 hypothetical protein GCM10007860_15420 [Chitiniphilus shinanonensis]
MDAFALFDVARAGMDRQQLVIQALANQIAYRDSGGGGGKDFSMHIQREKEAAHVGELDTSSQVEANKGLSYLTSVTDLMDAMRLYQMNSTVASAAKSLIERSLEITGR